MEFLEFLSEVESVQYKIIFTVGLILLYLLNRNIGSRIIKRYGRRREIAMPRIIYTIKYFSFVTFVFCLLIFGLIWDISFGGLSVYFLSFFTVAGVALFAAWSILSNVTAAVILFFYFPYRIGSTIRIIDGDNSIEGVVYDLNLFSIVIKTSDGGKVNYPNNLAIQKGIKLIKD